MNINQAIDMDIVSNGMNGEGVARVDGKVVFVPYTLCGERVRAVIKTIKKQYATASVIKVLEASPDRVTPDCPHYYKCGGCDMGHVSNTYRENTLVGELRNNLKKIAGREVNDIEFVRFSGDGLPRNKLSMPFGISGGKVIVGLYRQNTHVVEPVVCMLASERMKTVANIVCEFANAHNISTYNEKSNKGVLRHLVMREIGRRISVTLVINRAEPQKWVSGLAAVLPEYVDFFVSPNTKRNNVILGDDVRLVRGNARLHAEILGVKAEISPLSFLQVNDEIRDKLYDAALDCIESDALIDLYSGIGITSNLAAKKCKRIVAVECVPQAVEDADRTAETNGNARVIKNICGNVDDIVAKLSEEYAGADVLIDPPRKGCGEGVMCAVRDMKPNRIVYISCNHATMCRDIAQLTDYEITECKLFDMFPHTHHAETLVCLSRKRGA